MNNNLVNLKELQALLGMTRQTINKLVRKGIIYQYSFPYSRLIYFKREVINALEKDGFR